MGATPTGHSNGLTGHGRLHGGQEAGIMCDDDWHCLSLSVWVDKAVIGGRMVEAKMRVTFVLGWGGWITALRPALKKVAGGCRLMPQGAAPGSVSYSGAA